MLIEKLKSYAEHCGDSPVIIHSDTLSEIIHQLEKADRMREVAFRLCYSAGELVIATDDEGLLRVERQKVLDEITRFELILNQSKDNEHD